MGEKPHENDDHDLVERTCWIVMDVRIRIREITPENVADYFTPSETGEGLSWEWAERQNRLLLALLSDEETFSEFLTRITRDELHMLIESAHERYRSDDELFEKVYSKMDNADAIYFKTAKDDGLLSENTDLIHKAFVINWREASIKDAYVIKHENIKAEIKLSDEIG